MSRRAPRRIPHVPVRHVWRFRTLSHDKLLGEIREHAERGAIVRVMRYGGDRFDVIRNGSEFLVRDSDGMPIATVLTVWEAVDVGDKHTLDRSDVETHSKADLRGDDPKGAA